MASPQVTLKLATSLDGKIALSNGDSEWITGEAARQSGRLLRGQHDAICVGANTVELDNPQLTTRIDGETDPARVIFDSRLRLSPQSNLAQTARDVPVIALCAPEKSDGENAVALSELGVNVVAVPRGIGGLDIEQALAKLWALGHKSLLLEGGGLIAASFLKAKKVDRLIWYRAPIVLGGDGRDAVGPLGLADMSDRFEFERVSVEEVGVDLVEEFKRAL